jgi:membrane protein DedA with SNARE-associated domain
MYHGTELDAHLRLAHTTLVWVQRPGPGDEDGEVIHAEARLSVQQRSLHDTMVAVRRSAAERRARWDRRIEARLRRARQGMRDWPGPATILGDLLLKGGGAVARVLNRGAQRATCAAVEVPDRLVSATLRTEAMLLGPGGWRGVLRAVRHPEDLSPEEKGVVVFLTMATLLASVLLLNSIFVLAFPDQGHVYRSLLANAAVQFVNIFGVPLLIEPLLILATLTQGPVLAFTGFFLGKMLAVWVLYFVGDAAHDAFLRKASPRWKRLSAWLRRNANKYGFPILFLDNALPLMPDQVLWVFAVSGMRFKTWLLAVALGTILRFAVIIGGVYVVGPERIEQFFANPFA